MPLPVLLFLLLSSPANSAADDGDSPVIRNPFDYSCNKSAGKYTANSKYSANLNALEAKLAATATLHGYASGTVGTALDAIYGIVLCRFDLTGDRCGHCLNNTFDDAPRNCPNSTDVTEYQDQCQFRFADHDFLSGGSNEPLRSASNENNVTGAAAVGRFDKLLAELLNAIADRAANDMRRYGTGVTWSRDMRLPVYGLVQCTADMSPAACRACLDWSFSNISRLIGGGVKGGRINGVRCIFRYETNDVFFAQTDDMVRLHMPPKNRTWIWVTIAALSTVLLASPWLLLGWIRRRKRREKAMLELRKLSRAVENVIHLWRMEESNSGFSLYDFSQIKAATNNFSDENKLGQGGFGPVYKGHLPDGLEIAVKRLSASSGQGLLEFKNEIQLIAKLQHNNLVRLLGCCIQGDQERMLVYEYMPNKSLDYFIFGTISGQFLDWPKRLHIIDGITQGLLYLHQHSRYRVVHRDMKASNILLDHNMNPKISDFGVARIFCSNATESNTTRVVGTHGYIAPEYAFDGLCSIKSDVFSFGVLVLEIVSGKRTAGFYQHGRLHNLIAYAWKLWRDGKWSELIDPSLGHKYDEIAIRRCTHVALLCVQESAEDRPTMGEVNAMLSNNNIILPEPNQPAYFKVSLGNGDESFSNISMAITIPR